MAVTTMAESEAHYNCIVNDFLHLLGSQDVCLPLMVLVVGMYVMVSWRVELLYFSGQWLQAGWIRDIHATFALKQLTNKAFWSTMGMKEADKNVEACAVL